MSLGYKLAEDIGPIDVEIGDMVMVNGTKHYVTNESHIPHGHQYQGYTGYQKIMLGARTRVMLLFGLNETVMDYSRSVVLEEAVGFGPYKTWEKLEYVHELYKR